jgi:hypothetical protein
MKSTPDKQHLNGDEKANAEQTGFQSPEELIAFAQEYFSADFPNPERRDCPTPGTINATVRSGELPGEELRAHLFACSACFCEFREAMALYRSGVAVDIPSWWSKVAAAWRHIPRPALAGAACLVVLLLAGVFVWREHTKDARLIRNEAVPAALLSEASSQSRPEQAANSEAAPTPAAVMPPSSPSPAQARQRALPDLVAQTVVRIDLEDYTVLRDTRDVGSEREKVITLHRERARLLLRLPERSPQGRYKVSLVDSYGHSVIAKTRSSRDGKTLRTTLDLRGLTERRYRLSIARAGEAPGYYPVVIGDAKAVAK